jgi:hypothetical protein
MSKKITLPSGATVTLRDPKTLKQKDRKNIYVDGEVTIKNSLEMMENIIAALIVEWSFPFAIPTVQAGTLGELEIEDYDALEEFAKDAMPIVFPTLGKTRENEADPKAITDDSND